VLFRGPSGSGKSDLALRLVDRGARLVADDRVDLRVSGATLIAAAPPPIFGRLEVRGIGIVACPAIAETRLAVVVDLVEPAMVERMPEEGFATYLDIRLPLLRLAAYEPSAAAKVRLAVRHLRPPAMAYQ
jgi:serine kinase of HPr protein (carbohydrate metabolism regulator)